MTSEFFNKQNLSQTQLTQSAKTNLTGVDEAANAKAAQVDSTIDQLNGITNTAFNAVKGISNQYIDNIDKKLAMESKGKIPQYERDVMVAISEIDDIDTMTEDEMTFKIREINSSFMDTYKDSAFRGHLKRDLDSLKKNVMTKMLSSRDTLHSEKVINSTASQAAKWASKLGVGLSAGGITSDKFQEELKILSETARVAAQVPTSNTLGMAGNEKYIALTTKQANSAVLRGMMSQLSGSNSLQIAQHMSTDAFRKSLGIDAGDAEYNKVVSQALKMGERVERLNYSNDLSSLKEQMYSITNRGEVVDINKHIGSVRESGFQVKSEDGTVTQVREDGFNLTAKDEHKLRKEFKAENDLVVNVESYRKNLTKKNGASNITVNMKPKDKEDLLVRTFSDILDVTGDEIMNIDIINGQLDDPEMRLELTNHLIAGGELPKQLKKIFDIPAGSSPEKWNEANAGIISLSTAAIGTGTSIEEILGVNEVSKIRGMSKLLNNEEMDEGTKQLAIEALQSKSISFNSKGYLRGDETTQVDIDWLNDVSKDASWTTDDYVSNTQNADEIAGNYQAYKLAGLSDEIAQDKSLELFKSSNIAFEMPDGSEITIPKKHKYLNNESIIEFSKDISKFPSLEMQRKANISSAIFGDNWYTEWDTNNELSIKKSYNFAKSGEYSMLYKGMPVANSNFTYSEMEDFISKQDHKTRTRITGVETERPFSEIEEEALEIRAKKIETETVDKKLENILRLAL